MLAGVDQGRKYYRWDPIAQKMALGIWTNGKGGISVGNEFG